MRTTIRLDEGLLTKAKRFAASRNKTLTAVIEESLRETLARRDTPRRAKPARLTTFGGSGLLPGVDLDDSASLLDLMESPDAAP